MTDLYDYHNGPNLGLEPTTPRQKCARRAALAAQPAASAELRCRKCGELARVVISSAQVMTHWPDGSARDERDIASDPEGTLIHDPSEPLRAAAPQPQVQQADECGFTELTEKVAEIELAALEEALVKREKALAKWKANGSSGMDDELEAIHKEFHAACYAGRIQNVVYVLKAALADISRLRKAIEHSRPIDDSSAAPHNKHVAAFDAALRDQGEG